MHKSLSNQIKILQTKGMIIDDNSATRKVLIENNYYNVINGFKSPFLDASASDEQYKPNTSFDEIFALYSFDRNLRNIILEYSLIVENSLKTKIAYEFSKHINEYAYLETSSFSKTTHSEKINSIQLINKLVDKIEKNKSNPIYKHFIEEKNKEIPIWAAINFFDFGTIRTLYSCLNNSIQFNVANYFGVSISQLIAFLSIINMFRNVSAHDNRVMKYQIRNSNYSISDMPIHSYLKINKTGNKYIYGKNDLFALFIAFRYLLSDEKFKQFYIEVLESFNVLGTKIFVVKLDEIFMEYKLPLQDLSTGQLHWKDIINVLK